MKTATESAPPDPFAWLEAVEGEAALEWVRARNAESTAVLEGVEGFEPLRARLLEIYSSSEKIPYVSAIGGQVYNFWQDATHVRGIWRRCTLESFRRDDPVWETVLDLDALGAAEGVSWVWAGHTLLQPDEDRTLVQLSRGGGDAVVVREFDLAAKAFVEGGFEIEEARNRASWIDRDTLLVGSDFGAGSLTDAGYPRVARRWARGTPLADAPVAFEGRAGDVVAGAVAAWNGGDPVQLAYRIPTTFTRLYWVWDETIGEWLQLTIPASADFNLAGAHFLIELREDWEVGGRTWPAGALLAIARADWWAGSREFTLLFTPGPRKALEGVVEVGDALILHELDNVRDRFYVARFDGGTWRREKMDTPEFGVVSIDSFKDRASTRYWMTVNDPLTPTSLYLGDLASPADPVLMRRLPAFFDAAGLVVEQLEATSADGTRIPYFVIRPRDAPLDGSNPTILDGYGGFQVSPRARYSATRGTAWLERGGIYVVANIRGGGEFGPAWHQAALREHRQRAYDDFIAVAEDLIARGLTRPERLGITGGSNGGLLTGNMLVQRPALFGAVVSVVPLLDMRRYHELLAGASWMEEYGDPDDPAQWAWLRAYSPYHQVQEGVAYPPVLFLTSTRDDRVHPAHARKMVARMRAQGHAAVFSYENIEGGHNTAADLRQAAYMQALEFSFFREMLEAGREP